MYDLLIIGSGPAGLTASIYASRYKLANLVVGKVLGGMMTSAHKIENYPGFTSISGVELSQKMGEHVKTLGAEILADGVSKIEKTETGFKVTTESGKEFESKVLIVATGMERRKLDVSGEKEYLGRGVSYCTNCLLPGEEVVANSFLKKIEEIGIAQKVLTVDGTFQDINQIISRDYDGEIVKIKTRFFTEPVSLTANHPVLCTQIGRDYRKRIIAIDKPEWREAKSLTDKKALLYPIITETKDIKKIRLSEILGVKIEKGRVMNNQETFTSHRIADEIPVDEKFLRLAGYYLAEGCIERHGISFSFNKKEKKFISDVINLIEEIFSLNPHLKIEGGVMKISVFSKLVKDLFLLLFGKYAPNKKIPHWMLFLPLKKQKEIIKGLYRGDGCLIDKNFTIVTTSRALTYQLRDMFLRFGIIPSISKREKAKLNKTPGEIGRRRIRFNHDKYHLVVGGPSLEKMSEILDVHHPKLDKRKWVCRHAWIENNYLYLPIREIKRENYKGKVYNLAVEGNNTYIAKNFIVHNCDVPFFKDKTIALIGGSDAAASGAIHATAFVKKAYIIYRREKLRAEPVWVEEVLKNPKIEVICKTNITEILGDGTKVTGVKLDSSHQRAGKLDLDGVFIEIGGVPGTQLLKPLGVELDEGGFVKVSPTLATNIAGVFAAGDIANIAGEFQQIVIAASEGALAAFSAFKYLKGSQGVNRTSPPRC